MNRGTKVRTIMFAIACVNQAIVSVGDVDFGNYAVNVVYKVISTAFTIIAGAIALYFNNDFTEEGCIGTGLTRQMKAERQADYVGDYFYTQDEEEEEDEQDDLEADGQQMDE